MEPEKVDRMLRAYRACVGRCSHIDTLVSVKQKQIERLRESIVEDQVKTTSTLSDMPRSGRISDPTAGLALRVAAGFETEEILALRHEVEKLEHEREEKSLTIIFVDSWLKSLSDHERFVVETHICGGQWWREVVEGYEKKFGDRYSVQGLKRIQKQALNKIYKIAE